VSPGGRTLRESLALDLTRERPASSPETEEASAQPGRDRGIPPRHRSLFFPARFQLGQLSAGEAPSRLRVRRRRGDSPAKADAFLAGGGLRAAESRPKRCGGTAGAALARSASTPAVPALPPRPATSRCSGGRSTAGPLAATRLLQLP
jgi:hypothetical protein